MTPREQGDLGEYSAIDWLASRGAAVFLPIGHSPDVDLIALFDGVVVRVQVKTGTQRTAAGRYVVGICTRGGNQSWSRIVKRFSSDRCDYLFVLIGDGRRWFIPSAVIAATTSIVLGGPKYAEFEVERGRPIASAGEASR